MPYSLLITVDPRVVIEFETVAAVTGASVTVAEHPVAEEVAGATRVFVDGAMTDVDIAHRDVVVVAHGSAGPAHWGTAARLSASTIIDLPASRAHLSELLVTASPARSVTVAVAPVVGGSGASTLAVALASHAAKSGLRAAVIDADLAVGGLDVLAGMESQPGARWPQLADGARGDIAAAIVRDDNLVMLSGAVGSPRRMAAGDLDAIEALRAAMDLVVVDLPAHGDDVADSLIDLADFTVMVTPNTVRATAVLAQRRSHHLPGHAGLAVRMVAGARLDAMAVAEAVDIPLWATLPTDARVVEQIEQGLGPGTINLGGYTRALAHLARRILPAEPRVDAVA